MKSQDMFKIDAHESRIKHEMFVEVFKPLFWMHFVSVIILIGLAVVSPVFVGDLIFGFDPSWSSAIRGDFYSGMRLIDMWQIERFSDNTFHAFNLGVIIYGFGFVWLWKYHSLAQGAGSLKRGSEFVELDEFKKRYRSDLKDVLSITDGFGIPWKYVQRHVFISGTTGSGKTTMAMRMIEELRERGIKAVIYDSKGGELVSKFYDESRDLLYCPFDARSCSWNPFSDIEPGSMMTEFDSVSASAILHGEKERTTETDDWFVGAARRVISGFIKHLYAERNLSISALVSLLSDHDWVLRAREILKVYDPQAVSYVWPINKVTHSVQATLATHVLKFQYMMLNSEQEFNIRKWITSATPGFLFLPHLRNHRATLDGILGFLLDSIIRNLQSLSDTDKLRLVFCLDEFSRLPRLDSLVDAFEDVRSKGGGLILGGQNLSQIEKKYGKESARSIFDSCNTWAVFRSNEPDTADYMSKKFSESEHRKIEATMSSSLKDESESASFRESISLKKVVLPSEILNMSDYEFFLKMPNMHVTKAKTTKRDYEDKVARCIDNLSFAAANKIEMHDDTNGSIVGYPYNEFMF